MSAARLAGMAVQTPFAQYIGSTTHEENLATVPLPAGAQVGDFCIAMYSAARGIGGGSGTAWATRGVGPSVISGRQLLAGDFSTPIMLNDVSPTCVMVWRGPVALSIARTSGGASVPAGLNYYTLPGITKSLEAVAIVGATVAVNAASSFLGPPFQATVGTGLVNLRQQIASMTDLSNYTNGTVFDISASSGPGTFDAAVFELLA